MEIYDDLKLCLPQIIIDKTSNRDIKWARIERNVFESEIEVNGYSMNFEFSPYRYWKVSGDIETKYSRDLLTKLTDAFRKRK